MMQQQLQQMEQNEMQIEMRARLHVTDSAMTQQQERMRTRDRDRIQFPDCENHWARTQVTSGWAFGLIEGYPDGNFGPNNNVSGLEGTLMMTRLMNCLEGIPAGTTTPGAINWDGVPEWAKLRLQEQNAQRLMNQTNYYQDANMNRLHVAVMLAKGLNLEPVAENTQTQYQFRDQDQIPGEHLGYVLALQQAGIVLGDDGYFVPARNVTRAEICTMMVRVLDLVQ
jgi:hypothetical protein